MNSRLLAAEEEEEATATAEEEEGLAVEDIFSAKVEKNDCNSPNSHNFARLAQMPTAAIVFHLFHRF